MVDYEANLEKGELLLGGKRVVAHCNHYNVFLQQTLTDALDKEMVVKVQKMASKRMYLEMFNSYFSAHSSENKQSIAESIFSSQGLGVIKFDDAISGSGKVKLVHSHYAISHFSKWGPSAEGICYLPAGYIMAAIEFINGKEMGISNVNETQCIASDVDKIDECIFEVK